MNETQLTDLEGDRLFNQCLRMRRSSRLRRWHTEPGMPAESVAEHSFGTALILAIIAPQASSACYQAALLHDLGEQGVGDIPVIAKWASPGLKSASDQLEERFLKQLGLTYPKLNEEELGWLHAADRLDLCFTVLEAMMAGIPDAFVIAQRIREGPSIASVLGVTRRSRQLFALWRQLTTEDITPPAAYQVLYRFMPVAIYEPESTDPPSP